MGVQISTEAGNFSSHACTLYYPIKLTTLLDMVNRAILKMEKRISYPTPRWLPLIQRASVVIEAASIYIDARYTTATRSPIARGVTPKWQPNYRPLRSRSSKASGGSMSPSSLLHQALQSGVSCMCHFRQELSCSPQHTTYTPC